MTRSDAEAFLALPDRSRTATLKSLSPREREEALTALAVALGRPEEQDEPVGELAA